ncbi:MAG: hypothetical protein MRQ07_01680 [Candidatus Midichloria sp.]|nr:hypothetical protein [Candidatus Midichloria sp.]
MAKDRIFIFNEDDKILEVSDEEDDRSLVDTSSLMRDLCRLVKDKGVSLIAYIISPVKRVFTGKSYTELATDQNKSTVLEIDSISDKERSLIDIENGYFESIFTQLILLKRAAENKLKSVFMWLGLLKNEVKGELQKDLANFDKLSEGSWLTDENIRQLAQIKYSDMYDIHTRNNNYISSHKGFAVIQGEEELKQAVKEFQTVESKYGDTYQVLTRTLAVNLNNSHWVALVLSYKDKVYQAYFANSFGGDIPDAINEILQPQIEVKNIHNLSIKQQSDGYNCGLWVLENARDINEMLRENRSVEWLK